MVAAGRDWLDTLVGVSSALNTLLLLALLVLLAPTVWSFTRNMRQLRALLDRVYDDLKPLAGHANRIASNLDEITESVRAEVKGVTDTIAQAKHGLHRALESTDQRIRKVGALLDVAQEEAERAIVSTAATVRGVRAGAAAMRRDKQPANGPPPSAETTPRPRPPRPRVRARRKRPE